MKLFFKTVIAEAKKQHKNYFHNKIIYISLFFWPLLSFLTTYYSFQAFPISESKLRYLTKDNAILFLVLGYMCMSFFRSLVQSAWKFSFERISGTLELIYLSPANRQGILLGNAIASLFESIVLMVVFTLGVFLSNYDVIQVRLFTVSILFTIVLGMAVLWGMFLNAIFLFSRDASFLFTILEEPMEIFSGVKVPVSIFPVWAKVIGLIFPLTYALEAVRRVVLQGATLYEIRYFIGIGLFIMVLLYFFVIITLRVVEKHSRRSGNLTLF